MVTTKLAAKKWSLFFCFCIILITILSSLVNAQINQQTQYRNETIQFGLKQEQIHACTSTNNLFKIERLNYTTGIFPLEINYTQISIFKNNTNTTNYSKIINKFSSTKTGWLSENSSVQQIHIHLGNNSMRWDISSNCTQNNNASENKTYLNTTTFNTTINGSINNTINSSMNDTHIKHNNTLQNQTGNDTQNNCIAHEIQTQKQTYVVGEKIEMTFSFSPKNPLKYTYSIVDAQKNIIKSSKTTINTNRKTHTIKSFEDIDKLFFINLEYNDQCGNNVVGEKIIPILNPDFSKEVQDKDNNVQPKSDAQVELEEKSFIEIKKVENKKIYDLQMIEIDFEIYRGDTKKSTILFFVEQNGKRISVEQKVQLPKQYSKQEGKITIPLRQNIFGEVMLHAEGLDILRTKKIMLPSKIENLTTSKSKTTTTTKKEANLSAIIINASVRPASITSKKFEEEKKQTVLLGVSLTVLLIGIFIGFGPKRAIDTFIKR